MNHDETKHPILIMVRGMPGSGKSFLAAELQKALGVEHVVILDPDTIDFEGQDYKEFTGTPYAKEVDPKIHPFRYLKTQAFEGISAGKVLVWNQPFTDQGMFDRLVASLRDHAAEREIDLPVLLVEVDIDTATAQERVQQRIREGGHGPSEQTLERRIRDYESFAGNGYETVSVDGTGDVSTSVAAVQEAVRRQLPQK